MGLRFKPRHLTAETTITLFYMISQSEAVLLEKLISDLKILNTNGTSSMDGCGIASHSTNCVVTLVYVGTSEVSRWGKSL